MHRKNYKAIAESIHSTLYDTPFTTPEFKEGVRQTAIHLADVLRADNPNFRYDFFFEACGLDAFGGLLPE